MKYLFFLSLLTLTLISCKKEHSSASIKVNYIGKWQRTELVDTLFKDGKVQRITVLPLSSNPDTLNFLSSTSGTSTAQGGTFTYSAATLKFRFYNYLDDSRILKLSSTQIRIVSHGSTDQLDYESLGDTYTKIQ